MGGGRGGKEKENAHVLFFFFPYNTEKYTRGVSAVESILTLDRLRQSVAVKELLQAQGQPLMRKTASVPNFTQMLSRFDSSSLSDFQVCRSESVSELCNSSGEEPIPTKQYGIGKFCLPILIFSFTFFSNTCSLEKHVRKYVTLVLFYENL